MDQSCQIGKETGRAYPGQSWRRRVLYAVGAIWLALAVSGCTSLPEYIRNGFKVGPNFTQPPTTVAPTWIDAADKRVRSDTADLSEWWSVFKVADPDDPASRISALPVHAGVGALRAMRPKDQISDPILHNLINEAYRQNLTLRQAGMRILQARAQLGIVVGSFFPQTQTLTGSYATTAESAHTVFGPFNPILSYGQWNLSFNLAWEADFWGRYRRAIESADASLDASVFDYDDVLVTLLSDVATNYVMMRTTEERLKYTRDNVNLLQQAVTRIEQRAKVGVDNDLNLNQAKSILYQTEASIAELDIALRQATNQLCILLSIPPEDLRAKVGPGPLAVGPGVLIGAAGEEIRLQVYQGPIPLVPPDAVIGIPADLLRRRPDVRRAERQAAAQCALIGVAEADLYPAFSITGNLGYAAQQFKDVFNVHSFNSTAGPSFQWNVLNYGRLLNNVRLQDRKFRELVLAYQNTVFTAQGEVENGLIVFLKAQKRFKSQGQSVDAAQKAAQVVLDRYEAGTVDISQVLLLLENLVTQQDTLAVAKGEIAIGLIQTYKALGGGWEIGRGDGPPRRFLHRHYPPIPVPVPVPPVAHFGALSCEGVPSRDPNVSPP